MRRVDLTARGAGKCFDAALIWRRGGRREATEDIFARGRRQEIKKARSDERALKKTRRYLLSRFHNYHRLQALSFRIRDGNARFRLDIVAGKTPSNLSVEESSLCKSRINYKE